MQYSIFIAIILLFYRYKEDKFSDVEFLMTT